MTPAARQAVGEAAGAVVTDVAPLTGGCIGDVWRVDLADGRRLVAKTAGAGGTLAIEGYMLDYLARTHTVPVPDVKAGRTTVNGAITDGLAYLRWRKCRVSI